MKKNKSNEQKMNKSIEQEMDELMEIDFWKLDCGIKSQLKLPQNAKVVKREIRFIELDVEKMKKPKVEGESFYKVLFETEMNEELPVRESVSEALDLIEAFVIANKLEDEKAAVDVIVDFTWDIDGNTDRHSATNLEMLHKHLKYLEEVNEMACMLAASKMLKDDIIGNSGKDKDATSKK